MLKFEFLFEKRLNVGVKGKVCLQAKRPIMLELVPVSVA